MSMYRQLWLSIIASMLAALLASQFASLISARSYLETQLTQKNRDNATSLALALSQSQPDAVQAATAAKALFDSGYYELVRVADPQGRSILELVAQSSDHGAPDWFVRLLPIDAAPGQAQIINGWQQVGTITLLSSSRFAYRSLWRGTLWMAGVIVLGGLIGAVLGSLVLLRLRKPMRAVIEQAQAITEHRFVTIPEPSVPELRQLARAMNDTVARLRQSFDEDVQRYESMRQLANYEALTGLARRGFFLSNLGDALSGDDASEGTLAVARVTDLAAINRHYGREATDDLVKGIASTIIANGERYPETVAGRLNGSDFAILLPADCDAGHFLGQLLPELLRLADTMASKEVMVFIGYARFSPGETAGQLLARVDEALAAAEAKGVSGIDQARPAAGVPAPFTAAQWRAALLRALSEPGWRKLMAHPMYLPNMPGKYFECPLSIRLEADGEWEPASRFMPVAERLGLAAELDLAAVVLALDLLDQDTDLIGIWLHLSGNSLVDSGFRKALIERLEAAQPICTRLWLQVPEAAAMSRIELLKDWVAILNPLECRLGMAHCGHRFDRIGRLYELGLDFVKVDSSFVHGIVDSSGNRAFLAGLCEIAHRIGLMVLAEGVASEAEVRTLVELGFDGMTGPGIPPPAATTTDRVAT